MKKILSIFVLACIFLSPALTSSASTHDYDHVYTDVSIITPDSFEDIFSETEIDRVSYSYEMTRISNCEAIVAIVMEMKVGSDYYQILAGDSITSYSLPSGDILHEGPVDGNMIVGENEYGVTLGFAKLESTGGVTISITIQSDSSVVAISSFGDNVIQGEVLDFFISRNSNVESNTNDSQIENVFTDFNADNEESASALSIEPGFRPGFEPVFRPDDPEFTDLGEYGEWIYQDNCRTNHNNNNDDTTDDIYSGALEVVYYNSNMNVMLITLRPFLSQTTSFVQSLGVSYEYVSLHSMKVQLDIIETDVTSLGIDYGYIAGIKMPEFEGKTEYSAKDIILYNLFLDILDIIEIPTNTIEELVNIACVDATSSWSLSSASIEITTAGLSPSDCLKFDTITPGLPFRFQLAKGNDNVYEGNTQYKATSEVKYFSFTIGGDTVAGYNYYTVYSIVEGSIDIQ